MSGAAAAARTARVTEVVAAVARQALRDWRAERIALLDDGSPEAAWCTRMLGRALGTERVLCVRADVGEVDSLLHFLPPGADREQAAIELARVRLRGVPDALAAAPFNKTSLLLGGPLPPEPLLPLGDLYASEMAELCGGWSAPDEVVCLADAAGGIERLDEVLRRHFDQRQSAGLEPLGELADRVAEALDRGRASRINARIVPKIGHRTLSLDLFE